MRHIGQYFRLGTWTVKPEMELYEDVLRHRMRLVAYSAPGPDG